jgi:hypothetical protein
VEQPAQLVLTDKQVQQEALEQPVPQEIRVQPGQLVQLELREVLA